MAITTTDYLNTINTTSTANLTTSSAKTSSMISKDAFLKILMTQLKYQDPMDPMKGNEFMTQLAQISSVEQLTNISSSIDDMKSAYESGNISQWLSVIGRQINVDGSTVSNGDGVVLTPSGDYDKVVMVLKGVADGNITEQEIAKGDPLTLVYNGTDDVTVSAYAVKGDATITCATNVFRTVRGVQTGDAGLVAVTSDGVEHKVGTIKQIIN